MIEANNTTNLMNPQKPKLGLYIHLPFCEKKCDYCGFYSLDDQTGSNRSLYLEDLLCEIRLRRDWHADNITGDAINQTTCMVDTIFIGGGTPSLFDGDEIKRLLDGIRDCWQVDDQAEITMESNPNSLTFENLIGYKKAGINRLSIGIQSFDDGLLSTLGRLHNASCAEASVVMAKNAGFDNISLDLMFGLPGQSMDQWMDSLERAVSLKPTHLSLYTLQLEEGTRFYETYKAGGLPLLDDALDRNCYHEAIKLLKKHDFGKYEISNFSMLGFECRHNLKYWSMDEFFGFGPSASSYFQGKRWSNHPSLSKWSEAVQRQWLPVDTTTEKMDSRLDEIGIFVFTGLRKTNGISLAEFEKRFGESFFHVFKDRMKIIEHYRRHGLLDWSDANSGSLWLTESGIDISNQIMSEFV